MLAFLIPDKSSALEVFEIHNREVNSTWKENKDSKICWGGEYYEVMMMGIISWDLSQIISRMWDD